MRRFLLGALPLLLLIALGLASHMAGARSTSLRSRSVKLGAFMVAVVAVAYPVHTLMPVRAMAEETDYLGVVTDACATFGPRAAVVVVESAGTDLIDDWAPQALRAWCGAEVGVLRGPAQPDELQRLADEWNTVGRRFFVVSSSSSYVRTLLPNATFTSTRRALDTKLLAPTLTHRPDAYASESLQLVIASIAPR